MVRNSCHRASVASSSISSASCRKYAEKRRTWMSNTNCVHPENTQKGNKSVLGQMMISKTTIVPFVFQGISNLDKYVSQSTVVNRLWILFTLFQGSKRSLEKWTNDSIKTMLAKNTTQRKCEYHYLQSSRRIIDPSNSLQSQHFPAEFSGVNILILDTLHLIPIFCCHSQEVLAVRAISSDSILDHWNQTRKTNGTDMKQWHTHTQTYKSTFNIFNKNLHPQQHVWKCQTKAATWV